jgi:hypothetical protein
MADADLQVGGHQDRAELGVDDQLDVLEDRLGAPGGDHPAHHAERGEQSFAIAQGLHALSPPETC